MKYNLLDQLIYISVWFIEENLFVFFFFDGWELQFCDVARSSVGFTLQADANVRIVLIYPVDLFVLIQNMIFVLDRNHDFFQNKRQRKWRLISSLTAYHIWVLCHFAEISFDRFHFAPKMLSIYFIRSRTWSKWNIWTIFRHVWFSLTAIKTKSFGFEKWILQFADFLCKSLGQFNRHETSITWILLLCAN